MDVLTDVIDSLRLTSSLYCRTELSAPWGMELAQSEAAHFHVVEQGTCSLWLSDDGTAIALKGGDLVVLPHGRGHLLVDHPRTATLPLDRLAPSHQSGAYPLVRHGGGGTVTRMICGSFRFQRRATHPLLALLPPLIHVRGQQGRVQPWLEPTLRFLADESHGQLPGARTIITRLTDIIFVQAVRAWLSELPEGEGGWLGALRDHQIGPALAQIHREPSAPWTVASLAEQAAMSRSAFASRFTRLVGEPPMAYAVRWRMHLAAIWLRDDDLDLSEIARRAGYESEPAFSKAFKRHHGVSPGAFRRAA